MRMISFDKLGARTTTPPEAPLAPRGSGQFPAFGAPSGPPMLFADAAPVATMPSELPESLVASVLTAEIAAQLSDDDALAYALSDELYIKLAGTSRSPEL